MNTKYVKFTGVLRVLFFSFFLNIVPDFKIVLALSPTEAVGPLVFAEQTNMNRTLNKISHGVLRFLMKCE